MFFGAEAPDVRGLFFARVRSRFYRLGTASKGGPERIAAHLPPCSQPVWGSRRTR